MLDTVLSKYGLDENKVQLTPFGNGLINKTWKVETLNEDYILQCLNTDVFKKPDLIAENINTIKRFLQKSNPDFLLPAPIETVNNEYLVYDNIGNCYRLIPFVNDSHTIDVVSSPDEAFEAALQFGSFTKNLSEFKAETLHTTIPDFHNLSERFSAFLTALKNGNTERISETKDFTKNMLAYSSIVEEYHNIKRNPAFKLRVTHHDTKISNVLFNQKDKGICVIDLDTIMPGYFISDVGDMMRTYLSPISEESENYDGIDIRDDFYKAIVDGYCSQIQSILSTDEINAIFYSGTFLIFMQTLRFITDYLHNDAYYGARYPNQNLVRAKNQFTLLQRYLEKERLYVSLH